MSGVEITAGRMPHSDEAEQAVLGALLLDNDAFDRAGDILKPGDFYHPSHRAIYETLCTMITARKAADVITVAEAGHDMAYLHAMVMSIPSSANVRRYAEIVRERSLERDLIRAAGDIAADAVADGDVMAKIDRAQTRLSALGEHRSQQESVSLDVAIVAYLDHLQAEAEGRSRIFPTGLKHLDRLLNGGLREGELMVLGARPKMGKTALMLSMQRAMSEDFGTLVLSQEMPVNELVARHTAALGSINLADLRKPDPHNSEMWGRVSEALDRMRGYHMQLDDQRALTLLDVRRKVMAAKRRGAVDVVYVDFLQLMVGERSDGNRNQELDRISNGLKAMAGEFKVAVVLLSQCSREADKRPGPPVMTDLRDSGAIEAAADIIALLYREIAHPLGCKTEDWKHHAQLEVVQRNGAPGTVALHFDGANQRFADWDGPWPERVGRKSASYSKGLG